MLIARSLHSCAKAEAEPVALSPDEANTTRGDAVTWLTNEFSLVYARGLFIQ